MPYSSRNLYSERANPQTSHSYILNPSSGQNYKSGSRNISKYIENAYKLGSHRLQKAKSNSQIRNSAGGYQNVSQSLARVNISAAYKDYSQHYTSLNQQSRILAPDHTNMNQISLDPNKARKSKNHPKVLS